MDRILEAIPNFSEGRNLKIIEKLCQCIKSIKDCYLLDHSSDPDHNRTVITFAGKPEAVLKAAFEVTRLASLFIDIEKHQGVHPRIGATDVMPLVPIKGVSEEEAIQWAKQLGEKIGNELKIPVHLYEKNARNSKRKNLADIRKIEQYKQPDYGPTITGSAGKLALGVRDPLIAYNINLKSRDLESARLIARKIREKNGGLKSVKALGLELNDCVQVSMNLTNYHDTNIDEAFEKVEEEARKLRIEIKESEIIGLVPRTAIEMMRNKDILLPYPLEEKSLEDKITKLER